MAEKRRRRRQDEDADPATKEEYAVAKYLRFNSDTKEGKLVGMSVQCFVASKAVDALMESRWSATKSDSDILFGTRHSCITYCDRLLQKGLFHRAARVEKKKGDKTKKKKKLKEGEEADRTDEEKEKKSKKDTKDRKSKKEKEEVEKREESEKKLSEKEDKKEEEKDKEKKKKEKKLKLVMHDEQVFKDGDEVYVWIYDPVPLKTFVIGLLLVLGAIGLCLFPLWPSEVRVGVYYLSLSGAVFVGFILFLIVLRFVLFCVIWLLTFGKHHFWFLPNLTEDVGFFDSFRPLYKHDKFDGSKTDEKTTKTKKVKGSDEGDKDMKSGKDTEKPGSEKSVDNGTEDNKDEQNGFELVEKEDVDEMEENVGREDEEEESGDDGQLDESENEDGAGIPEEEDTEPKKTK